MVEHHWYEETIRNIMHTDSFSHESKQNENAFNHIQTIGEEKKYI
jgi:hypothetical protein